MKAFDTVFAKHMDSGRVNGQPLSALVAGDDAGRPGGGAGAGPGFDSVDAHPLENARLLEPPALLNIRRGSVQRPGTEIGFRLLHA